MGAPLTILSLFPSAYIIQAAVNCLRLLRQTARLPCSRALLSAGMRMAISRPIMAITTSSSMSVNALGLFISISVGQVCCAA